MTYDAILVGKTAQLRQYYDPMNEVGLLLDELIKDMVNDVSRKKVKKEAKRILKIVGDDSTAGKTIKQILKL
jgi:hypothetical protein